jgi:enoyl-CoA hydratase/carnithine racemase
METQLSEFVLFEKLDGHVAVVTLNRPEKFNAVNAAITDGLDAAVKRVEADPDIWIAILTSSNDRMFCAGADLAEAAKGNHAALATKDGGFAGFVDHPRTKIWIAAPKGVTVAGGLELCLACDMIVAADNCTFGLTEAKRGLVAAAGGAIRLGKKIPLGIAVEMIATGDPIDAQRAHAGPGQPRRKARRDTGRCARAGPGDHGQCAARGPRGGQAGQVVPDGER